MQLRFEFISKDNLKMDPNINRNSMGSRAGTAFKSNFGGGAIGAPSRLGTAGRVFYYFTSGKYCFRWSWINC